MRAKIQIGPETADLLVTAIYDQNKNYLGPMVTWELITEKLEAERKIQEAGERERQQAEDLRTKVDSILEVVNSASRGDLTREVDDQGGRLRRPDGRGAGQVPREPAQQRLEHRARRPRRSPARRDS